VSQASLNGQVVSSAFCSRMVDTSNTSLNEKMMCVQSIFHNVWTEVRKQEGLRTQIFVFNKGRVVFHQLAPLLCKYQLSLTKPRDVLHHGKCVENKGGRCVCDKPAPN